MPRLVFVCMLRHFGVVFCVNLAIWIIIIASLDFCLNGEKKTITLGNLKPFFSFVIAIFRFLRRAIFCWLKASSSIKFEKYENQLSAHVTQLCGRSLSKMSHETSSRIFLTIAEFHVGRERIESRARLSLPVCALNKMPFYRYISLAMASTMAFILMYVD